MYMRTLTTQSVELFLTAGGFVDGHFLIRGQHTDRVGLPDACFLVPGLLDRICRELADSLSVHRPSAVVVPAFGGIPYGETVSATMGLPLCVAERSPQGKFHFSSGDLPRGRIVVVDSSCHSLETLDSVEGAVRQAGAEVVAAAVVVRTMVEKFESRGTQKRNSPLYSFCAAVVDSWDPRECPMCSRGVPVQPKPVIRTRPLL
jgi:adenine/guanine phosphoribosyltransferase-like PRPP-binding protein